MEGDHATLISSDKNLMPSMVVRQQKSSQQHLQKPAATNAEQAGSATLNEILLKTREAAAVPDTARDSSRHNFDQDGLVLPRRVPHHHQQSDGQQPATMRDLNRELKFNQVRGLRVLDQKSELKRAMEKLEMSRRRKEAEQERLTRRSSLELRLEERAQRLAAREGSGAPLSDGTVTGGGVCVSQPEEQAPDSGILS